MFSNKEKLKKASISIGFFLLIIFISYMASSGVETPMKDGKILSEAEKNPDTIILYSIVDSGLAKFLANTSNEKNIFYIK